MKHIFLLFTLCLLCSKLSTQERWGSYETTFAGTHFQLLETCYDTIDVTAGFRVERLYRSGTFTSSAEQIGRIVQGDSVFFVNILTNEAPRLLYDYSMEVGDSIVGAFGGILTVIETGTENILGQDRKRMVLREMSIGYEDTWIEGLGSIKNGYLSPGTPDLITDAGSDYSCYYNEGIDEWYFGEADPITCLADSINYGCFTSGAQELSQEEIALFPNPVIDFLYLTLPENSASLSSGLIYNSRGILSRTMKLSESNNMVDVSELTAGVYYLILQNSEFRTYNKFVKI